MKKKIILALTACLFATVSIINMHLAQNNHNMDISLADISVMAQADGEEPYGNGKDGNCFPCSLWDPTIQDYVAGVYIACYMYEGGLCHDTDCMMGYCS